MVREIGAIARPDKCKRWEGWARLTHLNSGLKIVFLMEKSTSDRTTGEENREGGRGGIRKNEIGRMEMTSFDPLRSHLAN